MAKRMSLIRIAYSSYMIFALNMALKVVVRIKAALTVLAVRRISLIGLAHEMFTAINVIKRRPAWIASNFAQLTLPQFEGCSISLLSNLCGVSQLAVNLAPGLLHLEWNTWTTSLWDVGPKRACCQHYWLPGYTWQLWTLLYFVGSGWFFRSTWRLFIRHRCDTCPGIANMKR